MAAVNFPWMFIVIATAMTGLCLAFLRPLFRAGGTPRADLSQTRLTIVALREDARALDDALRRGELTPRQFDAARRDLERRLLDETDAPPLTSAPPWNARRAGLTVVAALPVLAFSLYATLGDPAAALRPARTGEGASATTAESLEELVAHVARRPGDARALVLLARMQFAREQYGEAAVLYARALTMPKVSGDPAVWCEYADALGMTQGGRLAGRPAELVAKALVLDPRHPQALEMAGSAAYERNDYATAVRHWDTLLGMLRSDSREAGELRAAIARAQRLATSPLAHSPTGSLARP